jgi:hypothetical protein
MLSICVHQTIGRVGLAYRSTRHRRLATSLLGFLKAPWYLRGSITQRMNKLNAIPAKNAVSHRERLRMRFLASDSSLADEQELELLLSFAIARKDVEQLARHLTTTFGNLEGVLGADPKHLLQVPGLGESSVCLIKLVGSMRRHLGRGEATKETSANAIIGQSQSPVPHEQRELFAVPKILLCVYR